MSHYASGDDPGNVEEARFICSVCGTEFDYEAVTSYLLDGELCPIRDCTGAIREMTTEERFAPPITENPG